MDVLAAGDVFLAPSTKGDVELVVGRVEPLRDVIDTASSVLVVHLQMRSVSGDAVLVGHSPFDLHAVIDAMGTKTAQTRSLGDDFEDGYETWRGAAVEGKAGVFTMAPADAYWMLLGVAASQK